MNEKFKYPHPVSDLDLAFPANVEKLMPSMQDIPDEFKSMGNKWNKVFNDMRFVGVSNMSVNLKEGVDGDLAFRHLNCVMNSYQPKHQHKEAACAYLMSLWFDDIQYTAMIVD